MAFELEANGMTQPELFATITPEIHPPDLYVIRAQYTCGGVMHGQWKVFAGYDNDTPESVGIAARKLGKCWRHVQIIKIPGEL